MTLDGYVPGVVSLAERDMFAPAKLSPEKLAFDDVSSIEVMGPWADGDWKKHAKMSNPAGVERILTLLESSVGRRGMRHGVEGDEEYMILITYQDGAIIRANLTTKHGSGATSSRSTQMRSTAGTTCRPHR